MTGAGDRPDRPPFAWLEDTSRPFGPVGVGTTIGAGLFLVAIGVFGLAYGIFGGPAARGARLGVGVAMFLLGGVIVWMGVARRRWRRRHPGVDPLEAARASGANVGSAFGNDSWPARLGRWLLVLVSAFLVLVCVLSVRRALTEPGSASPLQVVLIVALGLLCAWTGWAALARGRALGRGRALSGQRRDRDGR